MSNRKLGNSFEAEFCEILAAHDFWAHNMAQNSAGQPADVIAAKRNSTTLIDCKVCSARGFALSRIEDNQHLAMEMWEDRVGTCCWFALKLSNGEIFMIAHIAMLSYEGSGRKWLSEQFIRERGYPLNEWMQSYEVHG